MKKLPPALRVSSIVMVLFFAACVKTANTSPNGNPNGQDSTSGQGLNNIPKTWVVSSVAGSGMPGYVDGDSTLASFNNPQFIAIDLQGNLLVSDAGSSPRIREISPSRQVTTWASDTVGNVTPLFDNIYGLVVDSKGDVFDDETGYIRKFTSPTNSAFFAGQLLQGYKDDTGTNAVFDLTQHLAIDRQDNIFLSDYDMSNVFHLRKVTPAGVVTTLTLQDNTGVTSNSDGTLWYDYAIAVDSAGDIYVGADMNTVIKKVTPQGNVSILAGNGVQTYKDGKGTGASFGNITDMTCDAAGNLWVVDGLVGVIRVVTPDGTVTSIAGIPGFGYVDGPAKQAQFKYPTGIAIAKDGTIYVVDNGNYRIRKIASQ
jgi:NHL repeat